MFKASQFFDFSEVSHEIISEPPLFHQLVTTSCSFGDVKDVLSTSDPLLESLSHHDTVNHVSDSGQLVGLPVARSDSLGLLSLLLTFQSILKILLFILEILGHVGQLDHLLFVACLFPLEQSFGEILLVQIYKS